MRAIKTHVRQARHRMKHVALVRHAQGSATLLVCGVIGVHVNKGHVAQVILRQGIAGSVVSKHVPVVRSVVGVTGHLVRALGFARPVMLSR